MTVKKPNVFAHRGGRAWAAENTLAAFQKCSEGGVFGCELDVRRCATGELLVTHSADVSETTDGHGLISKMAFSEVRALTVGNHPDCPNQRIPLLSEVLELVAGRMMLNVEIKTYPENYPGIAEDVAPLIAAYPYPDRLILSSFDHRVLRRLRALLPNIKQGLLVRPFLSFGASLRMVSLPFIGKDVPLLDKLVINPHRYCKRAGVYAWHPSLKQVTPQGVAAAQRAGLEVNVWTANSTEEWHSLLEMGVDGIITDDPAGLLQYLARV